MIEKLCEWLWKFIARFLPRTSIDEIVNSPDLNSFFSLIEGRDRHWFILIYGKEIAGKFKELLHKEFRPEILAKIIGDLINNRHPLAKQFYKETVVLFRGLVFSWEVKNHQQISELRKVLEERQIGPEVSKILGDVEARIIRQLLQRHPLRDIFVYTSNASTPKEVTNPFLPEIHDKIKEATTIDLGSLKQTMLWQEAAKNSSLKVVVQERKLFILTQLDLSEEELIELYLLTKDEDVEARIISRMVEYQGPDKPEFMKKVLRIISKDLTPRPNGLEI
jgi:hypothetical protein